jgi:hypothetical protein
VPSIRTLVVYILLHLQLHPLILPCCQYFPLSAIFAGISMLIVESTITHKVFKSQLKDFDEDKYNRLVIGLGKATASALFVYLILKVFAIAHSNTWSYLNTPYGYWYLVETLGFVLLPALFFAHAMRKKAKLVLVA